MCEFVFTNVQIWEAIIFYFPWMHCQEMDRVEWALPHILMLQGLEKCRHSTKARIYKQCVHTHLRIC